MHCFCLQIRDDRLIVELCQYRPELLLVKVDRQPTDVLKTVLTVVKHHIALGRNADPRDLLGYHAFDHRLIVVGQHIQPVQQEIGRLFPIRERLIGQRIVHPDQLRDRILVRDHIEIGR